MVRWGPQCNRWRWILIEITLEGKIARYSFPRQSKRARRCLSDFFKPISCGERDVIGMSCVTVGDEVSKRTRDLFEKDEYTEYLYLHGIGVECAEALAEYWHKQMRMELGITGEDTLTPKELFSQRYRGSRYSFGYPACPEMEKQEILFKLLEPDRIGCTLTESWENRARAIDKCDYRASPASKIF